MAILLYYTNVIISIMFNTNDNNYYNDNNRRRPSLGKRLVLLELHGEGGTALVLFYFVVFVLLFVLCLLVLWRV